MWDLYFIPCKCDAGFLVYFDNDQVHENLMQCINYKVFGRLTYWIISNSHKRYSIKSITHEPSMESRDLIKNIFCTCNFPGLITEPHDWTKSVYKHVNIVVYMGTYLILSVILLHLSVHETCLVHKHCIFYSHNVIIYFTKVLRCKAWCYVVRNLKVYCIAWTYNNMIVF